MSDEKEEKKDNLVQEYFPIVRRIVVFLLGCAVIIDALWDRQYVVPELIIGMILVGVLPINEVVESMTSKRRRGV
jgi:hypothetical protein